MPGYLSLDIICSSKLSSLIGTDYVADKYPGLFSRQTEVIVYLCNNQINTRALIGQSAVGYCAGKPTEKWRVF